jgi:hypothetical protein
MKPISMLHHAQVKVYFPGGCLKFIYGCGFQVLACHMIVHGYEVTTKYKELLDEERFDFPLSYHIENHV